MTPELYRHIFGLVAVTPTGPFSESEILRIEDLYRRLFVGVPAPLNYSPKKSKGLLGVDDLRSYQEPLAVRLFNDFGEMPGALLALDMGLGKTVTTATAVRWLLDSMQVRRVLIVAPLRVAQKTWPDEFESWSHLTRTRWYRGVGKIGQKLTPAKRLAALKEFLDDPFGEVYIINRENVVWLYKTLRELGVAWPFDLLVYDESSRLKEGKKRTAAKNLSEYGVWTKVRKHMDYVIELTGTPAPKGLIDLWGQICVIDQGVRLGTSKARFLDRWFDSRQVATSQYALAYDPKPEAHEEIMEAIKDITVSMKARDYLDLPPVVEVNHWVDMSPSEMKTYRRFERESALEEYDIEAVNKGVLTLKLIQYANGSVYKTDEDDPDAVREVINIHDHKLATLDSIVAETNGASLLVAYSFKFDLERIKKRFPFAKEATEEGVLEDWNAGKVRMLLAHPASIGHGMNIQAGGHHTVWYGLTPSLELYQQFSARLPRSGQKAKRCYQHQILCRGTFDERLSEILTDRGATQDTITEAVKLHLTL